LSQTHHEEAQRLYGDALTIYRRIGDRYRETITLWPQARLLGAMGDAASAAAEAARIHRASGREDLAKAVREELSLDEDATEGGPLSNR
jgi:hypothetical protein